MDTVGEAMSNVVYDDVYGDAHNYVDVNTPACETTDAEHMYGCVPEGKGNPSPTQKSDGIG